MGAKLSYKKTVPLLTYMGELCVFRPSGHLVCLLALTEMLDCVVGFSEKFN